VTEMATYPVEEYSPTYYSDKALVCRILMHVNRPYAQNEMKKLKPNEKLKKDLKYLT
jgi:hypothetical protein